VFGVSSAAVVATLVFSLAARETAHDWFTGSQDWIVANLGWMFVLGVAVFLVVPIWLAFGRTGGIRLAADDDEPPEFPRASWLAMLFSAGMGIGLLFYGVAEPILHYAAPPVDHDGAAAAARDAMRISVFHWGLHAWGIYALTGLALAYFHHRRGLPLSMRSTLSPMLGRWTHRWPGKLVDVLAVFGTLFGLATSLGLGAMQINAGLARLVGAPQSQTVQVALIAVITLAATISLVTGLGRGIRRLSELNVVLAVALWAFVLLAGPTLALLAELPTLLAGYLAELPGWTVRSSALGDADWQKSWTLFYWAWWISWAPFVGIFVARISRGRTVREFVLGVLGLPTLATWLWFGVFGGAALESELNGGGGIVNAVQANVATAVYVLLDQLPWAAFSSATAAVVVGLFFVTSSDSGSYVVDTLTSGGHPDPPIRQRVFWASMEGLVAAVLLVVGGLRALQSAAINTGAPFCAVLLLAAFCLARTLHGEGRT
jgi:choline/glycine/proline betaine transport protein